MDLHALAPILLCVFAYALISGRVERSVLSAPILFVGLGLLLSPLATGALHLDVGSGGVHLLAELTLIVVLFTDAARIDLRGLRRDHNLPLCLLAIGMPLTIVLGALAGLALLPGLTLFECALLAAILAPTDAALGQAVVASPLLPVRIRQALNVESGLNDGITLPVVLILVACAALAGGAAGDDRDALEWAVFVGLQLTLGPLTGVVTAWLAARLIERAARAGWITSTFQSLAVLSLALLCYTLAEMLGGNGFIAAFVGGLTLGNTARGLCESVWEFTEAEGQLLNLVVFLLFGALMLAPAFGEVSVQAVAYALLSLTLVRLVPVAIALSGKSLRWETVAFIGWFGPRGLASILFALLVVDRADLPGESLLLEVVIVTVAASVLLHGLSANAGVDWYARRVGCTGQAPEHRPASEMPVRVRMTAKD